ncbi:MAG: hypothetical protein DID92_2727744149 [Candidatus Nitrotoga sp. SPKER]|nr:MAG: hypothetical protein DID92_2727744149 [Candidatus Nitrotoga sp. SPKER]
MASKLKSFESNSDRFIKKYPANWDGEDRMRQSQNHANFNLWAMYYYVHSAKESGSGVPLRDKTGKS